MTILRDRANMSPERIRIAELAKEDKERRFSSIAHLLTVEALQDAFEGLRKDASAGVDGVTCREYAVEVRDNLHKLHDQLRTGKYRAQPLRRIYIPKEDGRRRSNERLKWAEPIGAVGVCLPLKRARSEAWLCVQLSAPAGAAVWGAPTIDVERRALYVATGNGYTAPAMSTTKRTPGPGHGFGAGVMGRAVILPCPPPPARCSGSTTRFGTSIPSIAFPPKGAA